MSNDVISYQLFSTTLLSKQFIIFRNAAIQKYP